MKHTKDELVVLDKLLKAAWEEAFERCGGSTLIELDMREVRFMEKQLDPEELERTTIKKKWTYETITYPYSKVRFKDGEK